MGFSLSNVGGENLYLYDSNADSKIQLVFVPGVFSGEGWKYQLNFFSEEYRTVSFFPTVSNRGFEGQRKVLKQVIEQEGMDNIVLIGANFGNSLVQSFEKHENVSATVLVGASKGLKKYIPLFLYRFFNSGFFPCKLLKKFLMPSLGYEKVREFRSDVDFVCSKDFQSFQRFFGVRRPEKSCLVVHSDNDFFSDRDYAESLMSSASVSDLESGSFGFFEKPQVFNKVLHDFLVRIERKAVKEEVELDRQRNRELSEFTGSRGKRLVEVE